MRPKEVTAFLKSIVHYTGAFTVFIRGSPGVLPSWQSWRKLINLTDFSIPLFRKTSC